MKFLIPGFQQSLNEKRNDIKSDRILLFGAGMLLEASLISLNAKKIFQKALLTIPPTSKEQR
jgi:hypothetical protein